MAKKFFSIFTVSLLILFLICGQFKNKAENTNFNYKSYTHGIIDGGLYRIKNYQTGKYMTLENNSLVLNRHILLSNYQLDNIYQYYYVIYLGNDKYTFEPYALSNHKFGLEESLNNIFLKTYISNNSTSSQCFRITAVNSTQYIISSGITSYNKFLMSTYDSLLGWSVVQNNQTTLNENMMIWEFEQVDDYIYDNYTTYYVKDVSTGLYLTINSTLNNSLVYLCEFEGGENQRFKKYISNNGFGYYYVPMIKTDVAIEVDCNLKINIYNRNENQKFNEDYDSTIHAKILYYESLNSTNYICLGNQINEHCYDLTLSSDIDDAIRFDFELAYVNTPFISYLTNNLFETVQTSNYAEKHLYVFKPELPGDYNFLIKRNSGNASIIVDDYNGIWMPGSVLNYTDGQEYKVHLEQNKIYYITIWDYNSSDNNFSFQFLKDNVVYIHGMNTSLRDINTYSDRRTNCAVPCETLLNSYKYFDPILNTESEMNSSFVFNIDTTTMNIPINSYTYIFRGHGGEYGDITRVQYCTGTNSLEGSVSYICSNDLYDFTTNEVAYDLSGNKFIAWIGCSTSYGNKSIVEASYMAGSECALGFNNTINTYCANYFTIYFLEYICEGEEIFSALSNAYSHGVFWFTGLSSYQLYGNSNLILNVECPFDYNDENSLLEESDENQIVNDYTNELLYNSNYIIDYINLNDYVFAHISDDKTLKRYVKMINCIETDDYIDLYYKNNELVGYYKSKTTYSDGDLIDVVSYFDDYVDNYNSVSMLNIDGNLFNSIKETEKHEQIISYNNEILPLIFYVTKYETVDGFEYLNIEIYDIKNNCYVSNEVMFDD